MMHNTCNIGVHDLPDIYTLGLRAYISGKSLVPMLQILLIDYSDQISTFPSVSLHIFTSFTVLTACIAYHPFTPSGECAHVQNNPIIVNNSNKKEFSLSPHISIWHIIGRLASLLM